MTVPAALSRPGPVALGFLAAGVMGALLAYGPHLGNGYTLDDHPQIEHNPLLEPGSSWLRPFRQDVWEHAREDLGRHIAYYRPMHHVIYKVVATLGGVHAASFHVASLLLHLTAGFWGYALLRRFGIPESRAALAGALFLVHGAGGEAVYSAAVMSDQVLLILLLASLGVSRAIDRSRGGIAVGWGAALLGLVAAALFTKETAVVLAAILTIYAIVIGLRRSAWIAIAAVWILTLGYLGSRGTAGADLNEELVRSGLDAGAGFLFYLRMLVAPHPLTPVHPVSTSPLMGGLGLALGGVLVAALVVLRRDRRALFLGSWALLPLLPPLLLFFLDRRVSTGILVAERYLYLSLLPGCVLLALAIGRILRGATWGLIGVGLGLVVAHAVAVGEYGSAWRNDEAYYSRALRHHPESGFALHGLGQLKLEQGEFREAESLIRRAIEVQPQVAQYHLNLGIVLAAQSRLQESIEAFREGLRLEPGIASAHTRLADALRQAGRLAEAEPHYREAARLAPRDSGALLNHGTALYVLGRRTEAVESWEQSLEAGGESAQLRFNLGMAYRELGRPEESERHLRRFVAVAPPSLAPQRQTAQGWLADSAPSR